jgi:putative ABC transport system ATP-binding protein
VEANVANILSSTIRLARTDESAGSVVSIRGLQYRWPGTRGFALSVPSFEIEPGERLFLSGPSGSGKSTLLSLLAGVLVPQSGNITILGTDLSRLSTSGRDHFRVDHIGFVFQQFNLVPYLSVRENILLPCWFSPLRSERTLESYSTLERAVDVLLDRLALDPSLARERVTRLSVGQQQRVAVARALIGRPELIVADEPASALDSERQAAFIDLLLEQCHATGATLLFVSHDERLAGHFTRHVHMNDIVAGEYR